MSSTWGGRTVTSARAHWAPRLPLPCYQCGRPVLPTRPWVVEHITPRALGGSVTDRSNQWVSHRTCSDRSGGQMAAARTNAPRQQARLDSERARGIRGI